MKRIVASIIFISMIFISSLASADQGGFTLNLSGVTSNLSSERPWVSNMGMGFGGYLSSDYQPLKWMAIGLGGGYATFTGDNNFAMNTNSFDLIGRLMLPDKGEMLNPYLIGGAGRHFKNVPDAWQGNWHAMAGIGTRLTPKGGRQGSGVNLAVVYNIFSPRKSPLSAFEVRVGYSFAFGGRSKSPSTSKTPMATTDNPYWINYTLRKKDTLWNLAYRDPALRDPALYTILLDLNRNVITTPADIKPGLTIRLPKIALEKAKSNAYIKAWKPEYMAYRGTDVTRKQYDAWKNKGTALPVTSDASPSAQTTAQASYKYEDFYTVVEGDTLWTIACRKNVYADCELYPLIVEANRDVLVSPASLKTGVVLKIDRDISETEKNIARAKAWTPDFTPWRGTSVTIEKYEIWKEKRKQAGPATP